MVDQITIQQLKGLLLSAPEIKTLTGWPDPMVEDYLNILENIIEVALTVNDIIDQDIEDIPTDFSNGSIPYAASNLLVEDNTNLAWDALNKKVYTTLIRLNSLTANRLLATDGSKETASVTDLTAWIAGTTNQVTVTDDGDGTVTLATPQNIDTNADVEFDTLTLGDMTPTYIPFFGTGGLIEESASLLWNAGLYVNSGGFHAYADNLKGYYGAADDASVYYDGTNLNIKTNEVVASDLDITCGTGKTLELQNVVYEDLQVNISNVRVPVANAPTERLYDHGIGGGVTFPVLGFAVNDYFYFDLQSSHTMKLSTILENHFHYTTPTDGTGDKFKFQLDVIAAAVDGTWAVPTGSPFTTEVSMSADLSGAHKKAEIADIPAVNTTLSTIYKCKFTRIAATADEYAGEVYIHYTDSHYQKNTMGSRQEYSK
jgi:hypothetical protein